MRLIFTWSPDLTFVMVCRLSLGPLYTTTQLGAQEWFSRDGNRYRPEATVFILQSRMENVLQITLINGKKIVLNCHKDTIAVVKNVPCRECHKHVLICSLDQLT